MAKIRIKRVDYNPTTYALEFTGNLKDAVHIPIFQIHFEEGVATENDLPSSGNGINDARITNDTGHLYIWNGDMWVDQGDVIDIDWDSIQNAPDFELVENKDTDPLLSANSDVKYPSQKAIKTYTDNALQNAGQIF